jgi:hypothetical protein
MKIGILTFHFAHNYGAMLQAYALCSKLNLLGLDAFIIDYRLPFIYRGYAKYSFYELYRSYCEKYFFAIALGGAIKNFWKVNKKDAKWYRFEDFLNNVEKKTKRIYSPDEINSLKLDAVFCGSDQKWNESLTGGFIPCYFCSGIDDGVKKIAYAASNGKDTILPHLQDKFIMLIKNFDSISVREKGLANYLTSMHIDNSLVLDPVFLLEEQQWNNIAIEPVEQDYVLTYSFWENDNFFESALNVAKLLNKKLICLSFEKKQLPSEVLQICTVGPQEFLGYFKKASFVLTNSFHGTAFSILYRKAFYCVVPKKGRERIDSILLQIGLTNRIIEDVFDGRMPDDIDYSIVETKLNEMRRQSILFIEKALS